MHLCRHGYNKFSGEDIGDDGRFHCRYWQEDGRYPFLIRVSGKPAGFALV
jgi:predicted acetyltransferase